MHRLVGGLRPLQPAAMLFPEHVKFRDSALLPNATQLQRPQCSSFCATDMLQHFYCAPRQLSGRPNTLPVWVRSLIHEYTKINQHWSHNATLLQSHQWNQPSVNVQTRELTHTCTHEAKWRCCALCSSRICAKGYRHEWWAISEFLNTVKSTSSLVQRSWATTVSSKLKSSHFHLDHWY